jgi:hypothetical protein
MNVLGHDHVSDNHELVATPHALQHGQEQIAPLRRAEQGLPPVTTASDEM